MGPGKNYPLHLCADADEEADPILFCFTFLGLLSLGGCMPSAECLCDDLFASLLHLVFSPMKSIFKSRSLSPCVCMALVSDLTPSLLHFSHFTLPHTFDWPLFQFLVKGRQINLPLSIFNHCLLLFSLFFLSPRLSLSDPLTQSIALALPLPFLCFDSHILIAHFSISGINEIFIHTQIH